MRLCQNCLAVSLIPSLFVCNVQNSRLVLTAQNFPSRELFQHSWLLPWTVPRFVSLGRINNLTFPSNWQNDLSQVYRLVGRERTTLTSPKFRVVPTWHGYLKRSRRRYYWRRGELAYLLPRILAMLSKTRDCFRWAIRYAHNKPLLLSLH